MVSVRPARWIAAGVVAALAMSLISAVVELDSDVAPATGAAERGSVMGGQSDAGPRLVSVKPTQRTQLGDRRQDTGLDRTIVLVLLSIVLLVSGMAGTRRRGEGAGCAAPVLAVARRGISRRGPPMLRVS